MICPYCQSEMPDEAAFCYKCGKPLSKKPARVGQNDRMLPYAFRLPHAFVSFQNVKILKKKHRRSRIRQKKSL